MSFTEAIALPRGVRSMHSAGSRSALFVAVFLSIPLAFLMGFSARRVPAAPAAPLLRWSILIACGMAVLVSIVEAWFVRERNPWMSGLLLVWVLFVAILAMVTARRRLLPVPVQGHSFLRWVLVGAVPMAWAIVAIGCSVGFFEGCSHACTALRFTSAPLSILAVFLGLRDPRFYSFGLAVSAFALVPHCTCDNFGNHGWIAVVGASPMCALFGYATVLVSTAGLAGVLPRSCAGMLGVASTLVGSFAVGHHFLHFPW